MPDPSPLTDAIRRPGESTEKGHTMTLGAMLPGTRSLGATYWSTRFATWAPPRPATAGYTLLVPVPGDLPVFLEVALAVLGGQQHEHRIETLVIPDVDTPEVRRVFERHARHWDGELEMLLLPQPERTVLPRLKNPSRNHGVQVITGIQAARGSHVLLHDADLFLLDDDTLDQRWTRASERRMHALGISPVWDGWYAEHGLHLAATWELMAERDWLRAFPPAMHIGHTAELFGEQHVFDTTLRAQALSDPRRVAHDDLSDRIVHFNYVISTYRNFQRASGPFLDDRFRLVLVRLLIDLFADEPYDYAMPTLADMAAGLTDATQPIAFPNGAEHAQNYASFRAQLTHMLQGAWSSPERRGRATEALAVFDRHYQAQEA